jgi:hypothetical protein
MTPIKQVVFRRNGTLYMTSEINYNRRIPNASDLIKLEGFKNYDEVADYMWNWKRITRDYLIDKTGKEGW